MSRSARPGSTQARVVAAQLAAYLTARGIAGVTVTASSMSVADTPEHYPFHGQTVPAVHFEVTDREHFDSAEFGLELLAALHHLYPQQFKLGLAKNLVANAETLAALEAGRDPAAIAHEHLGPLVQFSTAREAYLLYR